MHSFPTHWMGSSDFFVVLQANPPAFPTSRSFLYMSNPRFPCPTDRQTEISLTNNHQNIVVLQLILQSHREIFHSDTPKFAHPRPTSVPASSYSASLASFTLFSVTTSSFRIFHTISHEDSFCAVTTLPAAFTQRSGLNWIRTWSLSPSYCLFTSANPKTGPP